MWIDCNGLAGTMDRSILLIINVQIQEITGLP
jgi:hypothetical protein